MKKPNKPYPQGATNHRSNAKKWLVLFLLLFTFTNFSNAQVPINNTCNTAITISNMPANDWDTATFASTSNVIWFTFTTGIGTDSIVFKLDTNVTNPAHIHKIVLFDDCNNLTVLKLGSGLTLTAGVNANTNYIIAVERAQGLCGRAACQQVEASFRYNLEERKQEDCVGFTFNGNFIPLVIVNPGNVAGLLINSPIYLPDNCSPLCFSDCDFFLIPPVWLNSWTFTLTGPNTNISGSGFSANGGCFTLAVGTYTFTAISTVMYPGTYTSTIVILPPQTFPPVTPNFNNAPYCSAADMVANTTLNNLAYYQNMFYSITANNQTIVGSANFNDLAFTDLCQGTYSLEIYATDYCNNPYSWSYPFTINYGVAFSAQVQNCLTVNFTNNTQCPGSLIAFEWDMGDGNIITAFEPGNYTYVTQGNYVITLYAYNTAPNCQPDPIVVTQHITVTYGQQLQITGPENTCCVNNNIFSVVNPTGFTNFHWTVPNSLSFSGQGTSQISINWPNQQPSTQPWAITVTATGSGDCELSATFYVEPCCYNCEILESMPQQFNNKKIETDFCSASYISQLTDINGNPLPQVGGVITLNSNTGYLPTHHIIIHNDLYIDQNTFMDNLKLIKIAPGKKIVVMPGVTFTANQCEMSYTCRKMWKGVEIMDHTATFNCYRTTISHAEHAVESFNGGVYKVILESKIENCYKGIVVNPYNGNHQGEIWQSFIQMQNPNNTLICPYLDKVTHTGIEIIDVANIQVGTDNTPTNKNTIRRIERGITSYRSNLTVYNNEFTNIKDPNNMICFIKCPCQIGTAVCAYSDGFTYSSLNIGGTQANRQNKVRFANIGVHVSNNVDANIVNNDIRDIDMEGIKIDFNWSRMVMVEQNTVRDANIGLYGFSNRQSTIEVRNNVFNFGLQVFPPSNVVSNTAIFFDNPVAYPQNLIINSNQINRFKTGVFLRLVRSNPVYPNHTVAINQNLINLGNVSNTTTTHHYGVRLETCSNIEVNGNDIKRTGANPNSSSVTYLRGVSITRSNGCYIVQNTIDKMGAGIYTSGTCSNSILSCNDLKRSFNSFFFNNAIIGDQEPANTANGNKYTNNFGQYYINGNIIITPLPNWRFRTIGNENIPLIAISPFTVNGILMPANAATSCPYPALLLLPPIDRRENEFGDIVRNQRNFSDFASAFIFNETQMAYKHFHNNNTDLTLGCIYDTIYANFYASYSNICIGKIEAASDAICNGNANLATSVLNSINPQCQQELNLKEVMDIYLQFYQTGNIDSANINLLETFAMGNSTLDGEAVSMARALLKWDIEDVFPGERYASIDNPDEVTDEDIQVLVYPNPASDVIYVNIVDRESQEANYSIEIIDMLGKKIYLETHTNSIHTIDIKNYNNGIYLLSITSNNKIIYIKKLIINK